MTISEATIAEAAISEESRAWIRGEQARYPEPRGALLPALHHLQERHGRLSVSLLEELASLFALRPVEVLAVVRFHPDFARGSVDRPRLSLCRGVSCALRGGEELRRALEADQRSSPEAPAWALVTVDCLGACDRAPAAVLDDELRGPASVASLRKALAALEAAPG